MLRMYPSSSTQQPAAQCLLRSPADAIHILESVRLGLIPRVTRRLTGHERAMIRPGTVWVWEEEETNMRRWTDGRRWGASRVGGGGFLVYREVEGGSGGGNNSPSASPPPSSRNSPSTNGNGNGGSPPARKAGLVKQTYSTSMAHPVTGRVKKFHVVAYSCKSDPGHAALPLPHQLPHLAYVKIMPGVWPDWEQRQDENAGGAKGKTTASAAQLASGSRSGAAASASSGSASGSYNGGPVRPPNGHGHGHGHSPSSRSGTPQQYYYPGQVQAPPGTPPISGSGPGPGSDKDRYHPYRHTRPPPAGFPSSLGPGPAPYGHPPPPPGMYDQHQHPQSQSQPQRDAPPPGMYDQHQQQRGSRSPAAPYEHQWPPLGGQQQQQPHQQYPHDRYLDDRRPLPPPERSYFDHERERERSREHEPIVNVKSPSPSPREELPIRSSYAAPFAHPSISAARDSHSRPGSPSLPTPDRNRLGIAGIMNADAGAGAGAGGSPNGNGNGITLPPLRLALDGREPHPASGQHPGQHPLPPSPGSGSEDASAKARKWGEDQRQLNQLGRMVGL